MVGILVMWLSEQTFVPLTEVGSIQNMTLNGSTASKEKMSENLDGQQNLSDSDQSSKNDLGF